MEKFNTDGIKISRDEATELCVHHLRLAALFFEVTPDDNGEALTSEIERQFERFGEHKEPALLWVKSITDVYDAMKKDDL